MRKGISWCVGAGNGSTSAALVLPSAKSNKQRSILPSKECSLFLWSRKRESNPPGSAWEADAIPLGDSCIWICNKQGSRKDFASAKDLWEEETQAARSSREERSGGPEGFAATREYLRTAPLRFARSVAGARPRTGSAWEADAKNRAPAKILHQQKICGKRRSRH